MGRFARITLVTAGVLLALLALLVAFVALFDWNRVKPALNERATAALGRPVEVGGDLGVRWARQPDERGWARWLPWPRITAADVTIGNPDWSKAPRMAHVAAAQVSVAPLPLLGRHVQLRGVRLEGVEADLERLADGRANWQFTLPGSDEPSRWTVGLDDIAFDRARIGIRDAVAKAEFDIEVDALGKPVPFAELAGEMPAVDTARVDPAALADYVFGWKARGRYAGQPVQGEGKTGGMLTLREGAAPFPLQADIRAGRTRATAVGTLTDPLSLAALDLKLSLSGASLSDLYPLTGVALPDSPPYATDGHLRADLAAAGGAVFDYRNFTGKVGQSDLRGSLRFAKSAPRPRLEGKLASRQLRLADLGPLIGVQSGGAGAGDAPRPAEGKVLPVQAFRTDRWADMDADVALAAGRIEHGSKLPLSDLEVRALLEAGRLRLEPLSFGIAGGKVEGSVALDGSQAPMRGEVALKARRMQLQQLFADAEAMRKSLGRMHGEVALSGRGNSVAALLGSATGEARVAVNDGVVSRSLMEIAGLNVGNYVVGKLFGDKEVAINCGVADLEVRHGLATPRLFLFDTENAVITVTGQVSLKDETLDIDVTPRSKGMRVFSLRSPLYVRGTFGDPKPGVHAGPLAARAAGAVALGVVAAPLAGLLALVAPSAGEEGSNACAGVLDTLAKPAAAAPKAGTQRPAKRAN